MDTLVSPPFKLRIPRALSWVLIIIYAILAAAWYLTFIAGPLWPVGRLFYLNQTNDLLRHDGVLNPRFERWVAWGALACLGAMTAAAVSSHWFGHHAYLAVGVCAGLYLYTTVFTFEKELTTMWRGLVDIMTLVFGVFALWVLLWQVEKDGGLE